MIISQFDSDTVLMNLMNQHMGWHGDAMANSMGFPKRAILMGQPGSGLEFLTFHGNFINDFFNWNNSHGDPIALAMLQAWITLPPEIKSQENATYQAADARITSNSPAFSGADQFGIFVETGIHNQFLHSAAAAAYGEPILNTFNSPKSTHFYQLHGWINYWWQHWYPAKSIIKDFKDHIKDHKEFKEFLVEKHFHFEKLVTKEIGKLRTIEKVLKEKDKDIVEQPGGWQEVGDPAVLNALHARITALEQDAQARHFISPAKRPDVGREVAERSEKSKKSRKSRKSK